MRQRWRDEVLDPEVMATAEIRAELRHNLSAYHRVQHPVSKHALAARIERLVEEMDRRSPPHSGSKTG